MSTKKVAAKSRSAPADVEAPAQTTAARRSAEAEVRSLIEAYAPAHGRLVASARRWLLKRLPTAHEIVYEYRDCVVISYSPNEHGYDGVFALRASANAVVLYFNQGKGLPDSAKVLQGSGKQTRSITLDGMATLARPEVVSLVDEALARNPVPYARAGRGSVLIRSTTAAKQRRPVTSKEPK